MKSDCRLAGAAGRGGRSALAVLIMGSLLASSTAAFAAEPTGAAPSSDSSAGNAAPAPSANVKEATTRFERGLALYDDGDFDAALVEFNRAYSLSPTYKILYNIAKIERVKNDYSSALMHFQRYLTEGATDVPTERREEVEKEIGVLKARVAELTIKANVEGAAVYVDDIPVCGARMVDPSCVGTTPLHAAVKVNPGTRKITAMKRGYQSAYAQITVAGGDQNTVKLDLFDLGPKAEDTGPRNRAIVAWTVTGALAIGAGVMGVLALNKKNTYDEDAGKVACEGSQFLRDCNADTAAALDSDKKSTRTFALVTDILAGAAVVGAGVSIYLTAKASGKSEPEKQAHLGVQNVRLTAGAGSAFLSGAF